MGEQEGIDHLLRAVRIIVHDLGRQDFSFTIIGGGPAVEGLRRLSRDLGVDEYVEFPGRVSDEELLQRLSTCDLCVNPDPKTPFNDASTMTKIMDYMALGKASVQFDLVEGRRSAEGASVYAQSNDEGDLARLIVDAGGGRAAQSRDGASRPPAHGGVPGVAAPDPRPDRRAPARPAEAEEPGGVGSRSPRLNRE